MKLDPSEAGILVETREATLIKFDGSGQPIQRKGWFVKPNESIEERNLGVPLFPVFQRPCPNWVSKLDAKVSFKGWPNPTADWKQWVAKLTPIYKDVWKQAKIFDAIQVSTCRFRKDLVSIWEVLPYWSNETNTFVFPFGEASITLEDTMVLGGFSPIGFCVREVGLDEELYKLKSQLLSHHLAFNKTTAKKACFSLWITHFMKCDDVLLEHIAFLSLWLSKYIFPKAPGDVVQRELFPLAILMAQGACFALGPAVLASLYRDIRLLKELLIRSDKDDSLPIFSPFCIVQMWVWEHFISINRNAFPKVIEHNKPWAARWHEVAIERTLGSRLLCQSSCDFEWRPYAKKSSNWRSPSFYGENSQWIYGDVNEGIAYFAKFLRSCEIVGLDSIQLYLPQRVSRHFGYDQDLFGCAHVGARISDWVSAWACYTKYEFNYMLYVPPRDYQSDVTYQYYSWWKENISSFRCFEIDVGMRGKKKMRVVSVESGRQEPRLQLDLNDAPSSFGVVGSFEPRGRCNIRIIKGIARARGAYRGARLAKNQLIHHANREASHDAAGEREDKQGRLHDLENSEDDALE